MMETREPVPTAEAFQQAFATWALPALPAKRRWATREFLNTESQFYPPGTRVTFYVEKTWRLLGFTVRSRDTTYPTYVIDKRRAAQYFIETAELALDQHEQYVRYHNYRAL